MPLWLFEIDTLIVMARDAQHVLNGKSTDAHDIARQMVADIVLELNARGVVFSAK